MRVITKSKRYTALFLGFFLCLGLLCQSLFATNLRVFDQAKLFSADEATALEDVISSLKNTYPLDIVIVTTDNAGGKTSMNYADDFYDEGNFGYNGTYDGILLLIDMDNRQAYISTDGEMPRYFTDQRISDMLDHITDCLKDGKYADGAKAFLQDVKKYMDAGIPSGQYNVNGEFQYSPSKMPHKPFTNRQGKPLSVSDILICLGMSLLAATIIAFITRAIIIHVYKHPRFTAPKAKPDSGSVNYTEHTDQFVTSHTSRVKIESNSGGSSSGRSSTHTSSGGHSHGGGGRGF